MAPIPPARFAATADLPADNCPTPGRYGPTNTLFGPDLCAIQGSGRLGGRAVGSTGQVREEAARVGFVRVVQSSAYPPSSGRLRRVCRPVTGGKSPPAALFRQDEREHSQRLSRAGTQVPAGAIFRTDRPGGACAHPWQRAVAWPAGACLRADRCSRGRQDLDGAASGARAQLHRRGRKGRPDA